MTYARADYSCSINFFGDASPEMLAASYGTPLYVYNEVVLRKRCQELMALSSLPGFGVNYSVKANSNPHLLKIIREEGLSVDAMSPGELAMDKLAGYTGTEILYISNNNGLAELRNAVENGCVASVDSLSQLETLGQINHGGKFMARMNPGIGAGHHAKVVTGGSGSKFGIGLDRMPDILTIAKKYDMTLAGLNQHIGSLFMEPEAYVAAAAILLEAAESLPAPLFSALEILDFGGGFGIPYHKYDRQKRLDMKDLGEKLTCLFSPWAQRTGYTGRWLVEPGRYVVAECGILLGQVTAVKKNGNTHFAGTDIGFNVLMRPVLYDSFHDIEVYAKSGNPAELRQTIVGNICESGDILAKDRLLPQLEPGDVIGVLDAGAYGFSMASNYNDRLLPAEVLICQTGEVRLIRRRQTLADLEACLTGLDN